MSKALSLRRGPPGVRLLASAAASLGDTQMQNLKPGCVPGVRTVQTCGLAGMPWARQRFFGPEGLSAPQSYTQWSGYPCYLLPQHSPLHHTHTHTHTHTPCPTFPAPLQSSLANSPPTSQNLTKKSEETGSYNVPKNTYKDPRLDRTHSPI